ncbi:MAG: hypothetical protein K0S47_2796 [Herbinix sp.]|jgi:hypothetical protein|nr:hypothetical protein [Herbinix sp.]
MDKWVILEIQPTADISTIKKAYAKQLRLHHPEDDPKGYQQLREAYDQALQYAKHQAKTVVKEESYETRKADVELKESKLELSREADITLIGKKFEVTRDEVDNKPNEYKLLEKQESKDNTTNTEKYDDNRNVDGNIPNDGYDNKKSFELDYNDKSIDKTSLKDGIDERIRKEQLIHDFLRKVEQLYFNFFDRIEIKNWEQLLNDEVMWQLDTKEYLNKRIMDYLSRNPYLSRPVWRYLNKIFQWDEQEDFLKKYYPEQFLKYLFLQLNEESIVPRFRHFNKYESIHYEEYLRFREQAYIALVEHQYQKAEQFIMKAFHLYSNDPDLYCLKGEYYYKTGKPERGKSEFNTASRLKPEDFYIIYYHAKVLYEIGFYKDAFDLCKSACHDHKDIHELNILRGECYYQLGKWRQASRLFIDNVRSNPLDSQSRKNLKKIQSNIRKFLIHHPLNLFQRYYYYLINRGLGEKNGMKGFKITYTHIGALLLTIIKLIMMVILILILIAFTIVSGGIALYVLIKIYQYIKNANERERIV